MAVSCNWFDANTLHMVLEGRWTIEEWLQAALIGSDMAFSEARYVDLVIEYRSSPEYMPPHILENVPKMMFSPVMTSDRIRRILMVNQQGVLRMTNEMFARSYGITKIKYYTALNEALDVLAARQAAI